jgi:hypothetical protein
VSIHLLSNKKTKQVYLYFRFFFLFNKMSIYMREDLTRNEKIQQARRILNENKYSLDAWAILIQDAQVYLKSKF